MFAPGSEITLRAVADPGSYFVGWRRGCASTTAAGDCVVTGSAVQVNAKFALDPKLTVVTGVGGSVTGALDCPALSVCAARLPLGSLAVVTAVPDPGYFLFGYSSGCVVMALSCSVTMGDARGVTVRFARPVLTVGLWTPGTGTVTSDVGGISCGGTCSATISAGTRVTLHAVADAGSTFSGWRSGCTSLTPAGDCVVDLDRYIGVIAKFNLA